MDAVRQRPAAPRLERGISMRESVDLDAVVGDGEGMTGAGFVRWLLGALAALLLVVGAVNWYVDATGVTGRDTRWRIAENAEVRSSKLDLYLATPAARRPQVVLLGSSRTMKFDPEDVTQLTGKRAFNASVSGGTPHDAWLFVQFLLEHQGSKATFPHLVWGLDADAFRTKQLRDGLSTDPRMLRFATPKERVQTVLATAVALTEWQTLSASLRAVRAGGWDGIERQEGGASARSFSATGFQQWSLPYPRTESLRARAIRRQIAQYASFIFERDGYVKVEDGPVADFASVVRAANARGDEPTIFLTPYHPLAEKILAHWDIADRQRDVRRRLERLQREDGLHMHVIDLQHLAAFDGDPSGFYDGVHMTPANTRRVLERLASEGVLAG